MGSPTLSDRLKGFVMDNITSFIHAEGELVPEDIAEKRKSVCRSCPFVGIVEPLPGLKVEGCTICGCPLATKAHMKTMLRPKDKAGEPLSFDEIIEMKTNGLFNRKDFVNEKIVCPHPDGNKWKNLK